MRILFVRTHKDSARCIERILVGGGHDVSTIDTISDLHGVLRAESFDLLLFGGVVARNGNAWDSVPGLKREFDVPAIVLSGYGLPFEIERSLAAGFSEHLLKPVMPHELLAAVGRVGRPAASTTQGM